MTALRDPDPAGEWLKANDPDYEAPAEEENVNGYEWGVVDSDQSQEQAKALLIEETDSFHTVQRSGKPRRGRQRVTAAATKVQRPGEQSRFMRICHDGAAIREVLGDDLATFRAAVREGRPSPARRADRERLKLKVLELLEMGAHQVAIARELECHRETVMMLAGRQGLYPQRRSKAA